MIKGATITASTMLPDITLKPVGLFERNKGMKPNQRLRNGANVLCTQGTIATSPQTPYTTEGMEANRSSSGFMAVFSGVCAYSTR